MFFSVLVLFLQIFSKNPFGIITQQFISFKIILKRKHFFLLNMNQFFANKTLVDKF